MTASTSSEISKPWVKAFHRRSTHCPHPRPWAVVRRWLPASVTSRFPHSPPAAVRGRASVIHSRNIVTSMYHEDRTQLTTNWRLDCALCYHLSNHPRGRIAPRHPPPRSDQSRTPIARADQSGGLSSLDALQILSPACPLRPVLACIACSTANASFVLCRAGVVLPHQRAHDGAKLALDFVEGSPYPPPFSAIPPPPGNLHPARAHAPIARPAMGFDVRGQQLLAALIAMFAGGKMHRAQ